jgi:hypothetical protein
MGRANLIGSGAQHLIPAYQPPGTGLAAEGQRTPAHRRGAKTPVAAARAQPVRTQPIRTQHTGLPRTPGLPRGTRPAAGRPAKPGAPRGRR